MSPLDARELLCQVGQSFHKRGLSGGASGNLSLSLPEGGYLATPTGCSLGDLTPEHLSLINAAGEHVGGPKPTKEVFVHLACYAARPSSGAVVHLHSPWATVWSCMAGLDPADAVPTLTPYGLMRYGRVALCPYRPPGSPALAEEMARLMSHYAAVLMGNHGAMVMGRTLIEAADHMEELEASCRLAFLLRGLPVRLLTLEEQTSLLSAHP